jgi:hypothetical protein
MVQVNYEIFDDKYLINYLNFLINKVYKILPISEREPETLKDYLESLLIELSGSKELIDKIKYDANFISVMSTLQYFTSNEYNHKTLRREIFKCIKIIEKLKETLR